MTWLWVRGVCASCINEQAIYQCTIRFCGCEFPISKSMSELWLNPKRKGKEAFGMDICSRCFLIKTKQELLRLAGLMDVIAICVI